MPALTYEQLTEAQRNAIAAWWNKNDPDGYTYECVDNTRFAVKGDAGQESAYEDLRDGGCCGFVDVELEVSGDDESETPSHVLRYGFNYGH